MGKAGIKSIHFFRLLFPAVICGFIFLLFPAEVYSVDFSISPIRVFFDGANKTSLLTIKNDSDEDVTLQLRAYTWKHDQDGKNLYSPTKDIIFFPRIFKINKDKEKIVRLGTRIPQEEIEKTYRLFIEEIPVPDTLETTAVRIIMKVGVPVFIMPVKTKAIGSIEKMELIKGRLYISVKNEGNINFIVRSIMSEGFDEEGDKIFEAESGGGYVHGGNSRGFEIEIPAEKCGRINNLHINISTNRISLNRELDVAKAMCAP